MVIPHFEIWKSDLNKFKKIYICLLPQKREMNFEKTKKFINMGNLKFSEITFHFTFSQNQNWPQGNKGVKI